MKNAFRLIITLLIVGGWALAASALHVVYGPGKLVVIPKDQLGATDTYVDVRGWTAADIAKHPAVVHRLVALNKTDVLSHVVDNTKGDLKTQLLDALTKALTSGPETPKPADPKAKK